MVNSKKIRLRIFYFVPKGNLAGDYTKLPQLLCPNCLNCSTLDSLSFMVHRAPQGMRVTHRTFRHIGNHLRTSRSSCQLLIASSGGNITKDQNNGLVGSASTGR